MYVDKKLGGVGAVQTLSRLNRAHPGKDNTAVLDFANKQDEIQKAFQPYYDRTILTEGTDPNLLHDLQERTGGVPLLRHRRRGTLRIHLLRPQVHPGQVVRRPGARRGPLQGGG